MPSLEIYINVIWLFFLVVISAFAGFFLRGSQLKKSKQKTISLENEMLHNHAEILHLQKEIVRLQSGTDSKTPVVHLKDAGVEEKPGIKERK